MQTFYPALHDQGEAEASGAFVFLSERWEIEI